MNSTNFESQKTIYGDYYNKCTSEEQEQIDATIPKHLFEIFKNCMSRKPGDGSWNFRNGKCKYEYYGRGGSEKGKLDSMQIPRGFGQRDAEKSWRPFS